jgi:quercetin dioxygenase-like cupin family protein
MWSGGGHPDVVVNEATGERVTFESETPELLTMLVEWPRPGRRAAEHIHPGMTETWHVLDGTAGFLVDGVEVQGGSGTTVVAPAGRRHLAWNAGEGPARLRIEMRPALRWRAFTTRFFAGEDPIALLAEFSDEITLPARAGPS